MSAAWTVVLVVSVSTVAIKATGPLLLGGRELPPRVVGVVELMAPALLAALIVVNAFGSGRHIVLDARAAGLAAATLAILLRAPLLLVVIAPAVTAAVVRLIT
jgi:branched-subunit amino acid transport protein